MEDAILPAEETTGRKPDPREVKRNYRLLSLDVVFYLFALAFIDQSTVLPTFLETLTKSTIIIGAITAIRPAGALLPQLWTAHYLRNRVYHKGFLVRIALISRIATALFAIVLFIAGPNDRTLILISFLVMYTAFWVSEGYAGVPWVDLVAKAVSERLRGRLFGSTQIYGGLLAIVAGLIITAVLSNRIVHISYPANYAILISIAAVLFAISLFSLSRVREPPGAPESHDEDFRDYIKGIGSMIAGHSQLRRFLILQALLGFFGMSLPFYVLYARKIGGLDGGEVGILLAIQTVGNILASAISGHVSDKYGPRNVILGTACAAVLAQALVFMINKPSLILYGILFLILGAIIGSATIGLINYLLEMADDSRRKAYIGLMNTANAPTMLFPIIGGAIIQTSSYHTVFAITGVACVLALIIALGLHPRPTCG